MSIINEAQQKAFASADELLETVGLPSYTDMRIALDECAHVLFSIKHAHGIAVPELLERLANMAPNFEQVSRHNPRAKAFAQRSLPVEQP